jgi:hypothetical protein
MEAATSSRGQSILLGRRYKDISLSVIVRFHVNFVVEIVIYNDSRTNEWIQRFTTRTIIYWRFVTGTKMRLSGGFLRKDCSGMNSETALMFRRSEAC